MQIVFQYCSRPAICLNIYAKLLSHLMSFVKNYFSYSPLKVLTMMSAGLISFNGHSAVKCNNGKLKTVVILVWCLMLPFLPS